MSARKVILEKLKDIGTYLMELDKEIIKDPDKKVKFAQETLDNDTVIEAEVFEAGQPVFIVNEEERVPLPVGEYTLADGRVLVVVEDGMIDSIGEAAEEEVEAEGEAVTMEMFNELKAKVESMLSSQVEASKEKEDNKTELEKVQDELKLSKENEVKLQKEIDETPDAKKIKVAPVELKIKPATTPVGRIVQHLNKIA